MKVKLPNNPPDFVVICFHMERYYIICNFFECQSNQNKIFKMNQQSKVSHNPTKISFQESIYNLFLSPETMKSKICWYDWLQKVYFVPESCRKFQFMINVGDGNLFPTFNSFQPDADCFILFPVERKVLIYFLHILYLIR